MIKDAIEAYGYKIGLRTFAHDRRKTVGASEIGLCARRVYWTKQGQQPDAEPKRKKTRRGSAQSKSNWGAHVRGTVIEQQLWLPAMRQKFGKDLLYAGDQQQTLVSGLLSATPDGLLVRQPPGLLKKLGVRDIGPDRSVVVECKSIDPRVNLLAEKAENAFQVQVQMGLIREKTRHKPDYAVISYVDASFWHDVAQFAVRFDPEQYAAAKGRAARIIRGDLRDNRPEGWIAGGKECEWCPFARRCAAERNALPPEEAAAVDPQFAAEIADLCREKARLDAEAKELEARAKATQDQIRTRLQEKGIRRIKGVVNWFQVKGRESWDDKAIREAARAAGVDVDQYQTVGDPTTMLSIDKKVLVSSGSAGMTAGETATNQQTRNENDG